MAKGLATWNGPTTNTDGSPFDQAQFAGYELELDGKAAVSIPVTWKTDGKYSFDVRPLLGNDFGPHSLRIRVVAKSGARSDFTTKADFVLADERVPSPPVNLAVA